MIVRKADSYPGGRAAIFALPFVLMAAGAAIFNVETLVQIGNAMVVTLSVSALAAWFLFWRKTIIKVFGERDDAAVLWLAQFVLVVIVTTVFRSGSSFISRANPATNTLPTTYFIAVTQCAYAYAMGCAFLVPLAKGPEVPPRGWVVLLAVVAASAGAALVMMQG